MLYTTSCGKCGSYKKRVAKIDFIVVQVNAK